VQRELGCYQQPRKAAAKPAKALKAGPDVGQSCPYNRAKGERGATVAAWPARERGMGEVGEITQMLALARGGDADAWQQMVAVVYTDLRRLAHRQLADQAREQTMDTTGLVHECYLRLTGAAGTPNDRGHFFALAARVMRQVIVDYARERLAQKRGGGERPIALDEADVAELREAQGFAALDDALATLTLVDERRARVVECRFFAGLTEEETAAALDMSLRSVQREWQVAREWLRAELKAD
jgi:RNA polymerase sigma factor (TIGR02999 family)